MIAFSRTSIQIKAVWLWDSSSVILWGPSSILLPYLGRCLQPPGPRWLSSTSHFSQQEGERVTGGQAPEGEAWALSTHPHTACGHAFSHVTAQGASALHSGRPCVHLCYCKTRGRLCHSLRGLDASPQTTSESLIFPAPSAGAQFPRSKWMGWCVDSLQAAPELQALQLPSRVLGQRCQKTEGRL